MNNPVLLIFIIFISSIICGFLPRKVRPVFALLVSLFTLAGSYEIFSLNPINWGLSGYSNLLGVDNLSAFVLLFIALFGVLIVLYSIGFMKEKMNVGNYYSYILATIAGRRTCLSQSCSYIRRQVVEGQRC